MRKKVVIGIIALWCIPFVLGIIGIQVYKAYKFEKETATFVDLPENELGIKFGDRMYVDYGWYFVNDVLPNNYELVDKKIPVDSPRYHIVDAGFPAFLQFREYFSFTDEELDPNGNFIIYGPDDSSLELPFCDRNMVVPTFENTKIEAVWFSYYGREKSEDEDLINELIECANDKTKILSDETLSKIKSNSMSGKDVWLKFKDYPIVAKYVINTSDVENITLRPTEGDFDGEYMWYDERDATE